MVTTDADSNSEGTHAELEMKLKRVKLELKQRELEKKPEPRLAVSTVAVGIVAALLGFMGNLIVTNMQARNALALERAKLQGSLVIESIKTGDTSTAAKNLTFLLKTGLLHDPSSRISAYLARSENVPVLPATAGEEIIGQPVEALPPDSKYRQAGMAVGEIQLASGAACTAFLISRSQALTTAHCVVNQPSFQIALGYTSRSTPKIIFPVVKIEEIDHDLDYAILKISANPGDEYGIIKLASTTVLSGDEVALLHHSKRMPLAVSRGKILQMTDEDVIYDCQTATGAGGAPVFNTSGTLVAIHVGGTIRDGKMVKKGVRIDRILRGSEKLRQIAQNPPKLRHDPENP